MAYRSRSRIRYFQSFFAPNNVREKDTEGTGLGLYIVKAIIDHSGGEVWFESPITAKDKEGQTGTAFYVTLPLTGMKKNEGIRAA